MKILKFGGKSLANGEGLNKSLELIKKFAQEGPIVTVVSARGEATDQLQDLLQLAATGEDYESPLAEFLTEQLTPTVGLSLDKIENELKQFLKGVSLVREVSEATEAQFLAYGEIIAAHTVSYLLNLANQPAQPIDARLLIETERKIEEIEVNWASTQSKVALLFDHFDFKQVPVVTGFIAADEKGRTTNLGRNGSNYTATILANVLNADEVLNFTNVNGFYSANPLWVKDAVVIPELSYREANELVNFGTKLLHGKTILPLIEKKIPLRILNSFDASSHGTVIREPDELVKTGLKAVSVIENAALVSIEGSGLLGKVGIDARIFNTLSQTGISVRNISQASSERAIGFVIDSEESLKAKFALEKEFEFELLKKDISKIEINTEVAVISIIGRHNYSLEKAIEGLRKNGIWLYLINNTINGEQISLVVAKKNLKKAVNVVHNQVYGVTKKVNLVCLGKGTVGKAFIEQVLAATPKNRLASKLDLRIVAVIDSQRLVFEPEGIQLGWETDLLHSTIPNNLDVLQAKIDEFHLENVVVVDNTAAESVARNYPLFAKAGFDIVASNKIGNTLDYNFYRELRQRLKTKSKHFLYETNVGAGLPLIDTIKQLYHAGDEIHQIRGVFSGSLSFIFNTFSASNAPFSEILKQAMEAGYTEPDPRIDLSGTDVARKLLILARELGYEKELEDVKINSLIPPHFDSNWSVEQFLEHQQELDSYFKEIKQKIAEDEVLRYVGTLSKSGELKVTLLPTSAQSVLGNLRGSDALFEIYTETYGDKPIVIQGAGAGAAVTARGVYSDVVRIANQL